jgi:dUTP pyrophosphatase
MINVRFKKLKECATIPTQSNPTDAGIDFYSAEEKEIYPGKKALVSTGVAWEPEFDQMLLDNRIDNWFKVYMKLFSRSGYASKYGIEVGAGVIDQEYRGEIKVLLYNFGKKSLFINKGSKIAQGIVYVVPNIKIFETDDLTMTVRNTNGFGSSGG